MKPGVLMVTGAYAPEISGGGVQCRTMIQTVGDRLRFRVLTTCTDPTLARDAIVDGIPVTRMFVDVKSATSKGRAALATLAFFARHHREFEIVHLHGFSQKSILIAALARLFGKHVVITMHTADQDDPQGVRRLGGAAYRAFTSADRIIAISEAMADRYRASTLPVDRLRVAENGVDTDRFAAVPAERRHELRKGIGSLPVDVPWIVFVGFFSADKCPDVLYQAWVELRRRTGIDTALLFAGATSSKYHEVDARLAESIRDDAEKNGWRHLVHFMGEVAEVERVYQAADIFVMPSIREAFGMALVEAMATGLPVVATAIAGVTDRIVDDGRTGLLVPGRHPQALADALQKLLDDRPAAASLGVAARQAVVSRYGLAASGDRWIGIYRELVNR